jgi:hypothetical protein
MLLNNFALADLKDYALKSAKSDYHRENHSN